MEEKPDSSETTPAQDTQAEIRQLADFLGRLVESSPFEIHFHLRDDEERICVEIEGPDREIFRERRGEGLIALQVLLRRVAAQQGILKPIFVDSEGLRQGREEEIAEIATLAAEKVRKLREPHRMRPMDPYERRLVHLALKDDPEIETVSEGEGFEKSVVIRIRNYVS
jgi:predicted RNA-binding protein Jag